ncbi:glycosyltransferase family 4 protein [Oscillochloris sp. ZM17-4]|uniref:glycosyltransferase family 4 protein n=1 Tax=Oscillochloris sp. ZM17-4 TaxID=2866714 RepID=UPI00210447C2|nr:glycosyltransferase family 4 protein [Oscillochloris sp. ZM17-4]
MVDFAALERVIAAPPETRLEGPTLLFAGKLEPNKGAGLLPAIFRELRELGAPPFTLLIAGDGALRNALERELGELGVRAQFLDWAGHDELLRLMARCDLLLFPSAWGEPLSRVLLEASSVGAPILAMPTGGTPDIIADGVSGALAATPRAFAVRLRELLADPAAARRLGTRARELARERYAAPELVTRYEELYVRAQQRSAAAPLQSQPETPQQR